MEKGLGAVPTTSFHLLEDSGRPVSLLPALAGGRPPPATSHPRTQGDTGLTFPCRDTAHTDRRPTGSSVISHPPTEMSLKGSGSCSGSSFEGI